MKVEQPKTNHQPDKRVSSQSKSGNQASNLQNAADSLNSVASPPASPRSFAKILEETRNQMGDEENFPAKPKTEQSKESAETDHEKETDRALQNRGAIDEKDDRRADDQDSSEGNSNSGFGAATMLQTENKVGNTSIPAARSILHVADLERIVSAIRAQNLKNSREVVIALKHSILEGLQIKLTTGQDGKLKAEFLAANEQIKAQLDARRQELSAVIRERGISLSELNIQQGSNFSQPDKNGDNELAGTEISSVEAAETLPADLPRGDEEILTGERVSYRV